MEIVGHRGSSFLAPENTLASFKLGWEETTTCELDIHATSDSRLLVIHDDSTLRTTGIDLNVCEHPLTELQQLDAGSWKGPQWKGEKLPSLEEIIAAMPGDKRLFIEIKSGPEIVPELKRVIEASRKKSQLMLQSFSYPVCVEAKKAMPDVPIYLLVSLRDGILRPDESPSIDQAIALAMEARLNGINLDSKFTLSPADVEKIHGAGLQVHVWTVDEVTRAKQLRDMGLDGLTTNRPGWMKAQLALG